MNTAQSAAASGVVVRPSPVAAPTPESVNAHTDHNADVQAAAARLSRVIERALMRVIQNGKAAGGTAAPSDPAEEVRTDAPGANPPT